MKLQSRVAARVSLSQRSVLSSRSRSGGGFSKIDAQLNDAAARLRAARHGRRAR